ncbi:hypothetical protein F9U64_04895 [Gracilibacillus oryzae]|uniref:ABC transporter periplasmic binding protein yphF n=1 Tax=Gracilibacillus oryzae TaxID=1672701 RepID=A0A7C8L009_9BACI|nr:hypothetical protein [Gracilibacillus oryzae]KAB8138490.1 hypothetical protein F9U64_04895 [Gracilibacillus oryzae]
MIHKNILLFIILLLLTGCMYPSENLSQNQISNDAQLEMVQQAINQYAAQNEGRLPIYTKENDTPIYQKYMIDFNMLKQNNLIQSIPGTAFESGGIYKYVLINVETEPVVKVIDLRVTDQLRDIQQRLDIYISENEYPPFGKKVADGVYSLKYEELNLDAAPFVKSPYSTNNLPVLIDTNGELLIDYRMEIYKLLENTDKPYQAEEDVRKILTDNYPIVPAYSIPYTLKDGEPVFSSDYKK